MWQKSLTPCRWARARKAADTESQLRFAFAPSPGHDAARNQILEALEFAAESGRDMTELLGIEGAAAALYFEQFHVCSTATASAAWPLRGPGLRISAQNNRGNRASDDCSAGLLLPLGPPAADKTGRAGAEPLTRSAGIRWDRGSPL